MSYQLKLGAVGRGVRQRLERGLRDDGVRPARLEEEGALRVADPRERVDRREHLLDVVPEIGRRGGDVLRHGRGAGRHQRRRPDAVVDARRRARRSARRSSSRRGRGAPGRRARPRRGRRAPRRTATTSATMVSRCQRSVSSGGEPRRRRRVAGGQRQRERHRATGGERRGERQELRAVAARAVEVDDGRDAALAAREARRARLDLLVAARVRDLTDVERTAVGELRARLEGERRVGVVGERVVVRARAAAARGRAARRADREGPARSIRRGYRAAATYACAVSTDADRRARAAVLRIGRGRVRAARPGYPEEAARWLAGDEPRDVVDLGAGTGKLTRSLVALGHRVTAVEPIPEMLAQLRSAVPGADPARGHRRVDPARRTSPSTS